MAGIIITPSDLEIVLGQPVDDDTFAALDRTVRTLIAGAYRGSIDAATGSRANVLSAVYLSVATRLLTNPTGARSVALGGASVTYGGSDASISGAFGLTDGERADLAALTTGRPWSIRLVRSPTDVLNRGWDR